MEKTFFFIISEFRAGFGCCVTVEEFVTVKKNSERIFKELSTFANPWNLAQDSIDIRIAHVKTKTSMDYKADEIIAQRVNQLIRRKEFTHTTTLLPPPLFFKLVEKLNIKHLVRVNDKIKVTLSIMFICPFMVCARLRPKYHNFLQIGYRYFH